MQDDNRNDETRDGLLKCKKVISVSIVYFETGQGSDYVYHGYTIFKGLHSQEELLFTKEQKIAFQKESLTDLMPEYYLIQACSFQDLVHDGLDEWIYLFKNSKVEDSFTAKGIDKAKEKLALAKLTKKKRAEYDQYLKSLHSEASWNETQRIKAEMEQKLIEATEKATELKTKKNAVINGLEMGFEDSIIAKLNNVSIEFIQQIREELKK